MSNVSRSDDYDDDDDDDEPVSSSIISKALDKSTYIIGTATVPVNSNILSPLAFGKQVSSKSLSSSSLLLSSLLLSIGVFTVLVTSSKDRYP